MTILFLYMQILSNFRGKTHKLRKISDRMMNQEQRKLLPQPKLFPSFLSALSSTSSIRRLNAEVKLLRATQTKCTQHNTFNEAVLGEI